MLQCVAVYCSVFRCAAGCRSVLQDVVCCNVLQCMAVCEVCCSVFCCSVLQRDVV